MIFINAQDTANTMTMSLTSKTNNNIAVTSSNTALQEY
jgi:hypothetical protein